MIQVSGLAQVPVFTEHDTQGKQNHNIQSTEQTVLKEMVAA